MKIRVSALVTSCFLFSLSAGCGSSNRLESYAPADLQAQAELDMEAGNYEAAKTKLLTLIASGAATYDSHSLYAASLCAIADVRLFSFLATVAPKIGSAKTPQEKFELIKGDSTQPLATRLETVTAATKHVQDNIPAASLTASMQKQLGIFLMFQAAFQYLVLVDLVKALDPTDPQALLALVPKAQEMIATLASSATALSGGNAQVGEVVNGMTTAIGGSDPSAVLTKMATP